MDTHCSREKSNGILLRVNGEGREERSAGGGRLKAVNGKLCVSGFMVIRRGRVLCKILLETEWLE